MNAPAVTYVGRAGGTSASTRSWEEQTGNQGFKQPSVFASGTNLPEPHNYIIIPVSNANAEGWQLLRVLWSKSPFVQLLGGNTLVNLTAQNFNPATNIVQSFGTSIGASTGVAATGYYGGSWFEPEIREDHNRVPPKRRFTVTLDLNFRGRRKALPIDDLE
jgi:hypothetical protein